MTVSSDSLPVVPQSRPEVWPLTPPQQALWFLENFNPGSSFYVIGLGLVLRGSLDPAALAGALDDTVARHEALRTRFLTLGGRPYQVFVPGRPVDLDPRDLSGEPDPEAAARTQLDELSTTPFDLGAEAPLRTRLLRLGPDHHVLLLAVHHIVFDGWSTQVLLADLSAAYQARTAGHPLRLPALETGVGEYAARLAELVGADQGLPEQELAHWREVLHAAPQTALPTCFPRPAYRTFEGASCVHDLDTETSTALCELARSLGTTPFTVLSAAFTTLVAQLSGSDDVVIGVPLAGRSETATHGLVGFFANALPLRVDLAGVRSFREAVERHRAPVHELLTRQHVPFARLVDALAPRRSANRNPYYDICFQYLPGAAQGVDFGGLELGFLDGTRRASQFDLSCDVHQIGDRLRIQFEYSTELFTERTMRIHLAAFVALLREVVAEQDGRVAAGTAPAPVPAPRAAELPAGGLAAIVHAQAELRPDAPAVSSAGCSLTFRELDEAAARFATALTDRGVTAGDTVGLLLAPSVELAVAILGVLRTGAAYVPGDVRTPVGRTAETLRQAACRVVVHDAASGTAAREAAAAASAGTLRLDLAELAGYAPAVLGAIDPQSPAYVIFTSGSTGRPKGVVVSHRAALSLAAAAAGVYRIVPDDTVLQMASPAVDVSVEEFFGSWQAGAQVYVHGPVIDDLAELVRAQRLSVLNLPAALWHEWTRQAVAGESDVPDCVRLVIAGSDRVDPQRVRQWRAGPGAGVRLLNAYGLTEAAVSSAWYDTAELDADAPHTTRVPIGRAYPHAALYVLDEAGVPVPDGVPGELWIGGPGVALGYLGDPEGTGSRFCPDPFQHGAGHRMYRTGDQVRRLPSGALDFRGRSDTQVKIRGTRIELAEVERVATEVPGVAQFVADVRPDEQGAPRLVGYLRLERTADGERDLGHERVEEWRQIHDADIFNDVAADQQADLNVSGWTSSYTQEPIRDADMAEWRDETVDQLLEQPPGRVLEIGCGTGMILLRVAPQAEYYVGTDISPRALRYVADQLPAAGLEATVRLVEGAAHDLSALADERFDLIVVNSVVQYFPSEEYLTEVIESAWRLLRPGGRLLIGDVRDLTLLRAFHLSVQRFRQADLEDPQALSDSVEEYVETENELCLSPGYFHALTERVPQLAGVEVRTKYGRADTEMNGFRYDAVLRRGAGPAEARPEGAPVERLDGRELTVAGFGRILDTLAGADALITGVRDARLVRPLALARELAAPECRSVAAAARLADARPGGIHPADLALVAARHGRRITVRQLGDGLLDVLVADRPSPSAEPISVAAPVLANRPLETAVRRSTVAAVREHLGRHLTKAMIPSRLVFVTEFPLSTGGKVDRSRLPAPARAVGGSTAAPVSELERTLATAWEQVLGADSIGTEDNFFEIGGDSIGWLQIMSRCSRAGVKLTARDVFEYQTIRALAAAVELRQADAAAAAPVPSQEVRESGLTPIQRWFVDAFPVGRDRQNQTQWYELAEGCPTAVLRQALHDVVGHHQALSGTEFGLDPQTGRWSQRAVPLPAAGELPLSELALPAAGPQRDEALAAADDDAQNGLSVTGGPLFRLVLFRTPQGEPDLLLWCVHHMVVDAVSWQFLDEDLDAALDARRRGDTPQPPPRTATFLEWSAWSQQASERLDAAELEHWHAAARAPGLTVPERHPQAEAVYGAAHRRTRSLAAPSARHGQLPGELVMAGVLSAVRTALAPVVGRPTGSVWLEFHGRPLDGSGPDTTRTVGWFTALFPFVLEDLDPQGVRAGLSAVPGGGIGYGRARYLAGAELVDGGANVVVNYLGGAGAAGTGRELRVMSPRPAGAGPDVAADAPMPFALEVNLGQSPDGGLALECTFSARHFDAAEADGFTALLDRTLARVYAALSPADGAATGPDLTLLPDEQRTGPALAALLARTGQVDAAYPLMPMQQMMLNRHLLGSAGDANYNESVLTLLGELDLGLFRAAWQALAARHEVLRTSVEWAGLPQAVQLVHAQAPDPVRALDWSALSATRVERRLNLLLEEERAKPPALSGVPPFRLTLVRTGPRESRLVWIDHHILLDGWSSSVLVRELLECYAQLASGRPVLTGAARPVAYRDYVRWTRGRGAGRAQEYWHSTLGGFAAPTDLPFDRPPVAVAAKSADYHERDDVLPPQLVDALRRLARTRRTTLGNVLAAGWAAFLQRFSGDRQVSFGMALSGRPAELGDVNSMVGLYLNTLPLVVRAPADGSAAELLDAVTRQGWELSELSGSGSLWDIYDWAEIPVSRTLFHSVLVVQNFGRSAEGAPGPELPLTARTAHSRILTGAPLTIAVDPEAGGLRLVWDSRVFAAQTATRIVEEFTAVLGRLAEDPDQPLAALPAPVFAPQSMGDLDRAGAPDQVVVPPQGPVEERIAQAWREVLGIEHVGRNVNLFEAGANSVTVMRLHSRLADLFDTVLSLPELFQHPTVQSMAELLAASGAPDSRAGNAAAHAARTQRRRGALMDSAANRRATAPRAGRRDSIRTRSTEGQL
ncbi:non-ribosomal peptide synthetase [Kitasatospora mediocidica]|uniref:non-ribosomal peptide synthetase n=1 Tax=Kitasatospora mediocidica TaxID=58352 RepID=UPI00055D00CE|nr:non-ribosomal peptide synthetase [Kitasatospora mediocidica]